MEKYKIVYIYSNCGNAMFTIMHNGNCLYQGRRDAGFKMKCDKVGEAYEMVLEPEDKKSCANPYCKIVSQIDTDDAQRLENLIEAAHLIIENAFSTSEEQVHTVAYGNSYYVSGLYYQFVLQHFDAIKKYFTTMKENKKSKQIQKIIKDYSEKNELFMLYRPEEIIAMHKNEYSIFASKKKIMDDLQSKLKNDSKNALAQIEQDIEKN